MSRKINIILFNLLLLFSFFCISQKVGDLSLKTIEELKEMLKSKKEEISSVKEKKEMAEHKYRKNCKPGSRNISCLKYKDNLMIFQSSLNRLGSEINKLKEEINKREINKNRKIKNEI